MKADAKLSEAYAEKQRILQGEKFLRALYRLIQTVKIHKDNNQLVIACAKDFVSLVSKWSAEDEHLTLQTSNGRLYIQDVQFPYKRETQNLIYEVVVYFEQRSIGGLRFQEGIKEASSEQILTFARLLNTSERQDDPRAWLMKKLEAGTFPWVQLVEGAKEDEEEESQSPSERAHERKEHARRTYSHALTSVMEVSRKMSSQRGAGVRKLKRIVQSMMDILEEDESLLVGLSTIRDYDDYTYTHSVNVAILSLCLGKRIGLSRISLMRLGICGMVHDLGKVGIPVDITTKPGKLTDQELAVMQMHPIGSVSQIVRLQSDFELKTSIILPPFEHHMKYDLTGYPRVGKKRTLSLFGRILTIADVFDAITSPRVYRPTALTPDRALGLMLDGSGKDFDPILLKVFINMLGVYPLGTLLQLDNDEMGLVMNNDESDGTRPQVVLLVDDGIGGFKKGEIVDLTEKDPDTGAYKRNVVRSLHPVNYGIQPAEFIL